MKKKKIIHKNISLKGNAKTEIRFFSEKKMIAQRQNVECAVQKNNTIFKPL